MKVKTEKLKVNLTFLFQKRPDFLHVFPDLALRRGVAQKIRRMKRRNQLCAAIVVHPSAQTRDRVERAQERPRGERAERDDYLRLDDVDLLEQEGLARLDLVRFGVPILGRPALDHVS